MTQTLSDAPEGYMPGFGNHVATEAVAGALPQGRNSPQKAPFGLYAEQLSGTAFTAPAPREPPLMAVSAAAQRQPSAPMPPCDGGKLVRTGPFTESAADAQPPALGSRCPCPIDAHRLRRRAGHLCAATATRRPRRGIGIHLYAANRSMTDRVFYNADGELLIVPQDGRPGPVSPRWAASRPRPARSWSSRAACASASSCRTARRAATSARTTARRSACRTWARSAPTAWPIRATS